MVNRDRSIESERISAQLRAARKEYRRAQLSEEICAENPLAQLQDWLRDAIEAGVSEPNAMVLATVDASGRPSARAVLIKEIKSDGVVFYSNYESRKGAQLAKNPWVAGTFVWSEIERQVRIEGRVEQLARRESEEYFRSRPRGAQIAAAISKQSSVLESRKLMEREAEALDASLGESLVPCPNHWGGYLIAPERMEFWQGRESRLHDRIQYLRTESSGINKNADWLRQRLWP